MSKRKATNDPAADFTDLDDEFVEIKRKAEISLDEAEQSEKTRCDALEAMFEFGRKLRTDPARMKSYFEKHGVKFNKTTQENPYNGLVQMAFGSRLKKAARSQYARTLHFAHAAKINAPVGQWLQDTGIADAYKEAVTHFSEPYKSVKGVAAHIQTAAGKAQLDVRKMSNPFQLHEPLEPGTYQKVLIRIDETGLQAVVADVLPISEPELEAIYRGHAGSHQALQSALSSKPLFALYQAVDLVQRLSDKAVKGACVCIRNYRGKTIVETAGLDHSFPWARMHIAEQIQRFDGAAAFSLSLIEAQRFIDVFRSTNAWNWAEEGNTTLGGVDKVSDPQSDGCQEDEAEKAICGLVVSRCQPATVFQL